MTSSDIRAIQMISAVHQCDAGTRHHLEIVCGCYACRHCHDVFLVRSRAYRLFQTGKIFSIGGSCWILSHVVGAGPYTLVLRRLKPDEAVVAVVMES